MFPLCFLNGNVTPRFCRVSVRGFLLLYVSVMFPRTETKAATQFVNHMLLAGWGVNLFISNFPEYIGDGNAVYKSEVLQILRFMVIMGKTQRIYTCNFSARKKFKRTRRFPSHFLYFSLNTAILKYRVET